MRVLFVCTDFPPATGGIQTMMGSLAAELTGWELTVLAPEGPGAEAFDCRQPYRVVRARRLGSGPGGSGPRGARTHSAARRSLPGMVARTVALATMRRPDLLLCAHPIDSLTGPFLRRALGIPYVVITHSRELRSPRLRPLLPRLFTRATRIMTNSRFTTREVVAMGVPEERVRLLPLGYDAGRFAGVTPSRLPDGLGLAGRPWLLTVARLDDAYKGIDTVLQALPRIAERVPAVQYVVAGDGRLRPDLERLAGALGCRDRAHFVGRVSDADLAALYEGCTAFVMASRDRTSDGGVEGFGLVFLEANSFGKPVLGGNSGGIPDAVLDGITGLLADPEDARHVADQAIRLLTDSDLAQRLGEQGRERVLRERTWSACAGRLQRVVEEALVKGPYAAAPDRLH
jgi:phosphatidylinositol alpha-1,6-mannosyltransferase